MRIRPWFDPAIEAGEIEMCVIVALELLVRVPRREYQRATDELEAMPWVQMTAADWRRARQVQGLLAARTAQMHRMVKIPDLLIAAAAERAGQTLIHYDRDFDEIQRVTQQSMRWIAPRG